MSSSQHRPRRPRRRRRCASGAELDGKIGAIGFAASGKPVLELAVNGFVDCAIIYYGEDIGFLLDRAGRNGVPVMFHFSDGDTEHLDQP